MSRINRKTAVAAYKERKVEAGIYALRCSATGGIWVGRAPDLSTIENRLRFALLHDANLRASLKAAVKQYGAEAIAFDVLESAGTQDLPYERGKFLRDRLEYWRERLGAEAI
jgi:hypothetical protein